MPSVSYDTLKKIQLSGITSPFLEARLQHSESSALLSHHIHPMQGHSRIYPTMVIPQASGRVGISNPPIGNFTADTFYGPRGLRDVVQPDRGRKWICPDWSAVEAGMVSHRCQDPVDLEARRRGLDLHTITAIHMLKYPDPEGEPTKEWLGGPGRSWRERVGFTRIIRDAVKNTRYSMNYSKRVEVMSRYSVALGIPPKQLHQFGHAYLKSKPWLVAWKEQRWASAWTKKEARTAFGRRRRLMGDQYRIEKEGLNHEIQGTVADMMKMTMVALARGITGCRMVLQRHDGWYSEVVEDWDEWDAYKAIVEREWIIDGRPISFQAEYETIGEAVGSGTVEHEDAHAG